MPKPFVITIDGPAGSGKSTTAQEVASILGFVHFNTGLVYRATGLLVEALGHSLQDANWCYTIARKIDLLSVDHNTGNVRILYSTLMNPLGNQRMYEFTLDMLKTQAGDHAASVIGSHDESGPELVRLIRWAKPVGSFVAEGRNLGSAVFADADIKFYLDADIATRAKRHLGSATEETIQALIFRDARDKNRAFAPLCVPPDAIVIDNTNLSQQETVDLITTQCKKSLNINL